ncbi:MAG: hypothetical protein WBA10_08265 [Elainellaceae cyanobacterium]
MTTANITLGEFERRHKINKGSVSRAARDAGFDTAKGLTPDAYTAMKEHFEVSKPAPVSTTTTIDSSSIQILQGNHRGSLPTPALPSTIDLGQFRGDLATTETADDPLALAANFIAAADAVVGAMEADEKRMAGQIAQTRQARRAVTQKAESLKQRQQLYSVRAEILAQQQATENEGLTDGLQVLQSMGNGDGSSSES